MTEFTYSAQPPPPSNGDGWGSNENTEWKNQTNNYHHTSHSGNSRAQYHLQTQILPVEPNPNLYIHNVPKDATEEELKDLFSTFGSVERIRLKVNQKIGPQALYAFVTFSSTNEAQLALQRLNGFDMRSRRLRIEFQRSREDDIRPHSHYEINNEGANSSYNETSSTTVPSRNNVRGNDLGQRRKRSNPSYNNQAQSYRESSDVSPMFKKTRQFDKKYTPSHGDKLYKQEKMYRKNNEKEECSQTFEPITIFLCETLRTIRPDIFVNYNKNKDINTLVNNSASTNSVYTAVSECAPPPPPNFVPPSSNFTDSAILHDEPAAGEIVWRGNLVRNGRKKVLVDLCYVSGRSVKSFLDNLTTLNISHRSTWDDLIKKTISSICYLQLSEAKVLDDGTSTTINGQKAETNKKFLKEHLQYLSEKQRAGVVTLSNNCHLYLLPPETPLFTKLTKDTDSIPQNDLIILGLFIIGSSSVTNISTSSTEQVVKPSSEPFNNFRQSLQHKDYSFPTQQNQKLYH